MRVIAGQAKGRRLFSVPGEGTRPITDRVKEALFNILGAEIEGASFLDLFAGTGGVGIEALSRGAERVVFVEKGYKALEVIRRNLEITGLKANAHVVRGDAFHYLRHAPAEEAFDYIYIAPPQYHELWAEVLLALDERPSLLAAGGWAIVQIHPKEYHPLPLKNLSLIRERSYGSTVLLFYALNQEAPTEEEG
ncbi:MAG: 16S rRNA (guanine(966)-N(2))-methyltransferase RsmD [Chloroflexi bacterium]|nr:16S rRNA (guanine(966)-N(2))-methyltransferase RsmD [Chloroflexota bacterium]